MESKGMESAAHEVDIPEIVGLGPRVEAGIAMHKGLCWLYLPRPSRQGPKARFQLC
jgi:hypothetical protein